jgi:3-deoxy-7-phosphoheptulonate synthase
MERRATAWSPGSWKQKHTLHQPAYVDAAEYGRIAGLLASCPPLVFPGEVERLKREIGDAGNGERFILQGGDCVERFSDCNAEAITNKLKIILQMSVILTYAARVPVVRIGRIAGQFMKPRTHDVESIGGEVMQVYRGDGINRFEPGIAERTPDPERLIESFFRSAATLNYIRAMIAGGFADLHKPYTWNLHEIETTDKWDEYRGIVEQIVDAIRFMETFGSANEDALGSIEFYTSHEGLHLGYEEALTRLDAQSGRYYNLGAHMLWIGDRTRQADGGHVEYFRGIANPIGIKAGAAMTGDELAELLAILNPGNEPGRITVITRLGEGMVHSVLPGLVRAAAGAKARVTWSCDPMHGNTETTEDNVKTRSCAAVMAELEETFDAHREAGSRLAGVHFELTGEDVTECIGGAGGLTSSDLSRNYTSFCDPRLNYAQGMEMAFLIAKMLEKQSAR